MNAPAVDQRFRRFLESDGAEHTLGFIITISTRALGPLITLGLP